MISNVQQVSWNEAAFQTQPALRRTQDAAGRCITSGYNFSMSLTLNDVEHIVALARLELTDEQKARYLEQLSAILDYIAKLQELDTADIPPTAGGGSVMQMPLRADEPRPGLRADQLLANTADKDRDQFKIPPVFE